MTGEAGQIIIVTGEEVGPRSLSPVGGAWIDTSLREMHTLSSKDRRIDNTAEIIRGLPVL